MISKFEGFLPLLFWKMNIWIASDSSFTGCVVQDAFCTLSNILSKYFSSLPTNCELKKSNAIAIRFAETVFKPFLSFFDWSITQSLKNLSS